MSTEATIHPQHVTISLNGQQIDSGRLLAVTRDTVIVESLAVPPHAPQHHAYVFAPGLRLDFAA